MFKSKSIVYIKGIAILMIILSHCYYLLGLNSVIINSYLDDTGRLGVLFFVTITGVLTAAKGITYLNGKWVFQNRTDSEIKYNIKDSLYNVYRKVRPLYGEYVFFLIIIFIPYAFKYRQISTFIKLIINLFLIQSFIPYDVYSMAYSFNTPAWYLSMMVFIWFMIPLTKYCYNKYAVLRKKNSWLVSLSIEIILLVLFYNCHFEASLQRWFMYVNPFINYLIFLTAFLYTKSVKAGSRNFKVLAIFCCILLALYMLKDYIPVDFRILFFQIPVLIVVYISYFNDAISEHNTTIKSMRFLNYIGENSNHLFLSHYFVCKIYRSLGINNVGIFILCWISIFLINYIDVLIGTKFKLLTKKVKAVES